MKRTIAVVFILFVAAVVCCVLPGLFRPAPPDSGGDSLRVVSLSPALTELICHLGQEKLLAARSTACDWPQSVKRLPTAGNFAEPELEKILSLKPDLVVSNDFINPKNADTLRAAGITVELHSCDTIEEYRAWTARMGGLLNCAAEADAELARIDRRSEELTRAVQNVRPKTALYVIWDNPLMAAGSGTLPDTAGRLAGLSNIVQDQKGYPRVSFEFVLQSDPDVIVWLAQGKSWQTNPSWRKLSAVRENRVLKPQAESEILRPGPRIFDGIASLKKEFDALFSPQESPAGVRTP